MLAALGIIVLGGLGTKSFLSYRRERALLRDRRRQLHERLRQRNKEA
jgi:hypothetical protein